MRKQLIHQGKNVVMHLKSLEVMPFVDGAVLPSGEQMFKGLTPIYIPFDQVKRYMDMGKQ